MHTLRGRDSPFIFEDPFDTEQSSSVNRLRRYIDNLHRQRVLNKLVSNIIYRASISTHKCKFESYNKYVNKFSVTVYLQFLIEEHIWIFKKLS